MQQKPAARFNRCLPYIVSMASVLFIITAIVWNFNNGLRKGVPAYAENDENSSVFTQNSSLQAKNTDDTAYILCAYNGKIGIFTAEDNTLCGVIEVNIDSLPRADAALLERGIPVRTHAELLQLIEDYES